MAHTRRSFLKRGSMFAASLPFLGLVAPAIGQTKPQSGAAAKPGLLFDASDLPRMKNTTEHPRYAPYWQSLTATDPNEDTTFLKNLRLNNHVYDMLKARQILERTSFVYVLTRDPRQLEVAKLAMRRIMDYKRWDYFLEGGKDTIALQRASEATVAMSFARDWLADALTAKEIDEIEAQIAGKGAPACYRTLYGMKYPDRVKGWGFDPEDDYQYRYNLSRWPFILNATNLKVIPIAGLGVAACLLHGRHPQADQWLNMARQSARAFSTMFGTDGAYDEGVSYWGYTALHLTLFAEVMYRTLGIDDRDLINYPGTVRYALCMSMPTIDHPDDCVNFGDASIVGDTAVAAWVAHNHKDGVAQYVATSVGEVKHHCGIIWYDDTIPETAPGPGLLDVRLSNDLVVSRTGWDVQSSVLAMRSGPPANHEHADRNSIVFKAYGERLFHDPFKAAYSYTLPDWLLRQTEAHTSVLIDGKGHQYHDGHEGTNSSWAFARIMAYAAGNNRMTVTSDATDAYQLVNENVLKVMRTLVFLKPDVVAILDRVRLKKPGTVQLRFQVFNKDSQGKATASQTGFGIERPHATLQGVASGTGSLRFSTGTLALPESIGVFPYASVDSPASVDHTILTVCTAQAQGKSHGNMTIARDGAVWKVRGSHNGMTVDMRVNAQEDVPTVDPRI